MAISREQAEERYRLTRTPMSQEMIDHVVQRLKWGSKGLSTVIDYFYICGDEDLLRPWIVEILVAFDEHVESIALSMSHPAMDTWVEVQKLVSAAELQEYYRRKPALLTARVSRP